LNIVSVGVSAQKVGVVLECGRVAEVEVPGEEGVVGAAAAQVTSRGAVARVELTLGEVHVEVGDGHFRVAPHVALLPVVEHFAHKAQISSRKTFFRKIK